MGKGGYTLGENEIRWLMRIVEWFRRATADSGGSGVQWPGAGRQRWARITVDNGDGTYDAVEQKWSKVDDEWKDKEEGLQWTAANDRPLLEHNGLSGLATDTVVPVFNRGDGKWLFRFSLELVPGFDETKDQSIVNNQGDIKWMSITDFNCDDA